MNTKKLSSKVLLVLFLILGIVACEQNSDETPQFIEPITYQTSLDEMPELGQFLSNYIGSSKGNTDNIPEVGGGENYSDLIERIDFDYILARMDTSGQTYMSMSIANEDPKVIQNLVIGKDINQNLLTPMIFTYTMDDEFYDIYLKTGSLEGFSGNFHRVNLTPFAYTQNENAANIAQYRSSTSDPCPDETTMEPNTDDDRTSSSTNTTQTGTTGSLDTSSCTYEMKYIGEICVDTYNGKGDIVGSDCQDQWVMVVTCPEDDNEYSSSDDPCENPNDGEVPVVNIFLMFPAGSNYGTLYPKFTKYLSTSISKIQNVPSVMNALMQYSCLSEQEINENLAWGQGPEIHIVDLSNVNGGAEGSFNPAFPNVINIDQGLVEEYELSQGNISDGLLFYLGVTVLHEFVHFGIKANDCDNTIYEEGELFEVAAYGEKVSKSTALIRYEND